MKWSEVTQLCLTLRDPMDCSLPGSSVHGIFQARVLEWVAISFSRGSSWPRYQTRVSRTVGRCYTIWATREILWINKKGETEDEMVRCRQWLNGHEFEQTQGDSEGQGNLLCCSPWGCKELDLVTEQQQQQNNTSFNKEITFKVLK